MRLYALSIRETLDLLLCYPHVRPGETLIGWWLACASRRGASRVFARPHALTRPRVPTRPHVRASP